MQVSERLILMSANGEIAPMSSKDALTIERAITTALSDAEPVKTAPAVAVKALRWRKYGNQHGTGWYGMGTIGYLQYVVDRGPDGEEGWFWGDRGFDTEDEAKAAVQSHYDAAIISALSAQVQDVAVPAGWKLVPVEPTEEMYEAARYSEGFEYYSDMLAAAPTPPAEVGGTPATVTHVVGDEARRKLSLWFFRDLSGEQRGKLFALFGLNDVQKDTNHGYQSMGLAHVVRLLATTEGSR